MTINTVRKCIHYTVCHAMFITSKKNYMQFESSTGFYHEVHCKLALFTFCTTVYKLASVTTSNIVFWALSYPDGLDL